MAEEMVESLELSTTQQVTVDVTEEEIEAQVAEQVEAEEVVAEVEAEETMGEKTYLLSPRRKEQVS